MVVHGLIDGSGRSDALTDHGERIGSGEGEFREGGVRGDTQSSHGNWRILTKLRTDPTRATYLLRALLVLTNLEVAS
ncbi:hypothetical protein ACIQB5_46555 [Streptomyces sp. NPDC088560]|uniref:hypothetical protein n=1 Tax=Streptomyces sp. NPDC088560 TaxID=3365868 RepID=UPI0037FB296C